MKTTIIVKLWLRPFHEQPDLYVLNVIEIVQKFTFNEKKKRDSNDEISNLIVSFFILNEEGKVWSYPSP